MSTTRSKQAQDSATRCNATALRKAMRRVSLLYDVILAPCGLRSTQRSILIHISRAGQPSMGDLATSLVMDRSALAHTLKPLERDGLIKIAVDPRDKRSRVVMLTNAGKNRLKEATTMWQEAQRRFEVVFGVRNAQALRRTLDIVASERFAAAFEKERPLSTIGT